MNIVTAKSVDEGKDDKINLMNIRGYGGVAIYWGEILIMPYKYKTEITELPLLLYMLSLKVYA